ncbi:Imidazole glycerol phosphate synthase hisHF [Grifola frondosa]|uniref:Imidazole glycerol phosphate synthase hisHF n=1 Tax=Grifola frondosa TaxID=5627 RepID=A0A1C7MQV8_GRIFR|nr:Imidazole glycerol phosphate synthase hisHF [Grifola frondosa]
MGLYLLDYGAGNVQSLANTLKTLGHEFQWISSPADFYKATSLIFPGVGAFGSAIDGLKSRGLFEPLREYLLSGKPYFGICIGMQVLFQSSTESPSSPGLGIVPNVIDLFDNADKSVPHMGWNSVEFLDPAETELEAWTRPPTITLSTHTAPNISGKIRRRPNGPTPQRSMAKKYFCLPPQSARRVAAHIRSSAQLNSAHPRAARPPLPKAKDGLTKRIIACMDVRSNDDGDLVVTKGDQYDVREKAPAPAGADPDAHISARAAGAVRNLGKPVALAARYYAEGADELDTVDPDGTPHSALEVAATYFRAGADKVSIATEAVYAVEKMAAHGGVGDGTSAIEAIAHAYGRQAVVVSVDPRRVYVDPSYDGPHKDELVFGKPDGPESERGKVWWYQCTVRGAGGPPTVCGPACKGRGEAWSRGDLAEQHRPRWHRSRFDLDLVGLVRRSVRIPVVASSGAGSKEHFVQVFEATGVEAALAAGIFHRREVGIDEVKEALKTANIAVRK